MTKTTPLLAALIASAMLAACGSDSSSSSNSTSSLASALDSYPASGTYLSYQVLRSDLVDGKTGQPFEIRNGGYGSAMTADPNDSTRFYAMTDRGPNADYTGTLGAGKMFPTPDYTPRIGLFQLRESGVVELVKTILLKRPDGTPITGLPNSSALGGTGEIPYDAAGNPIVVDQTLPYDATSNPLKLDDYGLDSEGLVALKDGTFWVSDEYGPHMVHFDADGKEIGRINPFAADSRASIHLPAEFGHRWANRGMEGLAVTPDQKTLVGIMQSTLYNPNKTVKNINLTRIVTVNLENGQIGQYLYKQDANQNSNCELAALSATQFLVIERDGNFLYGGPGGTAAAKPMAQKQVYRFDLATGTNLEGVPLLGNMVQDPDLGLTIDGKTLEQVVLNDGWDVLTTAGIVPVSKQLVVDMVAKVSYPHDKMEGLWIVDSRHLGVLNDDDFATWATGGVLEQKLLDGSTIDGNHLYIVDADIAVQ